MQPARSTDATGHFDKVSNRRPKGEFVYAGANHMPGNAEQPVSRGVCRADARIRGAAIQNNLRNVDQRFHVVDNSRLAKQSTLRGERRLVARLAAVAFDGIEQRGFFAANIRARAAANLDVKRESAPANILAQKVLRPRGMDRLF